MNDNVELGRASGIKVSLNWSLLVAFWLIAWSLAEGVFPSAVPSYSSFGYWVAGIACAMLFLASLVVHEMGHAVVARHLRVRVDRITLWLFGGVSRLGGEARTPASEMRIAAIGPVVSLGIAGVCGVFVVLMGALGGPSLVRHAISWVGWMNLILAGLNLAPVFPLDGGRILRAILWSRSHDRIDATVRAALAGRVFGYVLIGVGLIEFATRAEIISGLWLVFLGWFLLGAARSEETSILLRDVLGDVNVREVMSTELVMAPAWVTIDRFINDYAMLHLLPAYPVQNFDGSLFGIVTWTHLRRVTGDQRDLTRVQEVATSLGAAVMARPEEPLTRLLERLDEGHDGYALVVERQSAIGIVGPDDITRAIRRAALLGASAGEGSLAA